MVEAPSSSEDAPNPSAPEQRVWGESHGAAAPHGVKQGCSALPWLGLPSACFQNNGIIVDLAAAITKRGISVFRFDFSGNGEREGKFQYGMYRKEADDLHSVVSYLYWEKYDVAALVGHSKYGFNHRLVYYNPGIHYLCY